MSRNAAPGIPSIGQMIDSIWHRLPENHYLFKIDPSAMPSPHENFLIFGKAVIGDCEAHGTSVSTKLTGSDFSTWLRLVGAWALYQRKSPKTRNIVAKLLGMDPSNLTNFINGKRALTTNAMTAFSLLFGIQSFDLKPDLGANFARTAEKKVADKLESVSRKIDELRIDVEKLLQNGFPVGDLMTKIEVISQSVRA